MSKEGQRLGANEGCVFCGGRSGVAPDQDGYHCLVCGAPRVLVDSTVTRMPSEKPALVAVQKAQKARMAWSAGTAVSSVFGVIGLAVSGAVALLTDHGPGAVAAALSAVILPFAVAALGFTRARRRGAEVKEAYDRARAAVTSDLVRAQGRIDAGDLSRTLHVSVDEAERLLAHAEVDGLLTDTGSPELRLRVDEAAEQPERGGVAENHQVRTRERH